MIVETRDGRDEPARRTVRRIAKILSHEFRHLTGANHKPPSFGTKSLMISEIHKINQRESDADKFESNLSELY